MADDQRVSHRETVERDAPRAEVVAKVTRAVDSVLSEAEGLGTAMLDTLTVNVYPQVEFGAMAIDADVRVRVKPLWAMATSMSDRSKRP